jgi:hypothetical protein
MHVIPCSQNRIAGSDHLAIATGMVITVRSTSLYTHVLAYTHVQVGIGDHLNAV